MTLLAVVPQFSPETVTHPSTSCTQCCLTSLFWQEPVAQGQIGRSHRLGPLQIKHWIISDCFMKPMKLIATWCEATLGSVFVNYRIFYKFENANWLCIHCASIECRSYHFVFCFVFVFYFEAYQFSYGILNFSFALYIIAL